jgi:hypothetical protein
MEGRPVDNARNVIVIVINLFKEKKEEKILMPRI